MSPAEIPTGLAALPIIAEAIWHAFWQLFRLALWLVGLAATAWIAVRLAAQAVGEWTR